MAMCPKNVCSFADLTMGVIDNKAKFDGVINSILWYRDNAFDLSTQGKEEIAQETKRVAKALASNNYLTSFIMVKNRINKK